MYEKGKTQSKEIIHHSLIKMKTCPLYHMQTWLFGKYDFLFIVKI